MIGTMQVAKTNRWLRYVGISVLVLVIVAIGVGGVILYLGISGALEAEINLHATEFVVCLVEQFVHDEGRWPTSWDELEKLPFPSVTPSPSNVHPAGGRHCYEWPAALEQLQERVAIDFRPDVHVIVHQSPMEFTAIKPVGPFYEYRDYGEVRSLQEALSKTIQRDGQREPSH